MDGMLTSSLLSQFRLTCLERSLGVYGVHVYQEGQGAVEHHVRSDDRVHLWSASKTYTSLAVGRCVDDGRLSLSDLVLDHFPEFADIAAPGSGAIRVVDLLHMQPGKNYDLFQTTDEDEMDRTDWAELFFRGAQTCPPGTRFFYANACTYMLSRLVEKVTGQGLRDFLVPRLFAPLGVRNPWWNTCPRGHTAGAFGLQLTLGEFSRLPRLLLQEGVWDDTPLVSAEYVRALHTDVVPQEQPCNTPEGNAGYGYQVWCNTWPGSFRADGMYGQYGIVVPDRRAAITVTAHNELNATAILTAVFADIVPAL